MLTGLRKNAKRVLWPLTVIIIIGMGGWGAWEGIRSIRRGEQTRIATFRGRSISSNEWEEARYASLVLARLLNLSPDNEMLERMTRERILLGEEARLWGIEVTDPEVVDFVKTLPVFQSEKKFDPRIFQMVLKNLQIPENIFEKNMRQLVAIERLRAAVQNSARATPAEVDEFYQRLNEKVRADYVVFKREDRLPEINLSEDEIKGFYNSQLSRYQVPEQVRIDYILIQWKDFQNEANVSETEIDEFLRQQAGSAQSDQEITRDKIRNILGRRKAEQRAEEIDRLLYQEETLVAVAKKFSLPLRQTPFFARGESMGELERVEEINRTAFEIAEKAFSHPVILPEGICFFQVAERTPARVLSLAEAQEMVEKDARQQKADVLALRLAREKLAEAQKLMASPDVDLRKAAAQLELEVRSTPAFSQMEAADIEKELGAPALPAAAFLTPLGQLSEVFPIEVGHAFLQVVERTQPEPVPEEESSLWIERAQRSKAEMVYRDWFYKIHSEFKRPQLPQSEARPTEAMF